ncbi:diaminopimelate epimerase [Cytophagaceae bacterium ABcell3]|nr:diaminopimelate epimerase [Cytophagaceae bacterium ABcell3]
MILHFYKYQGTGNDFVMIDNRKELLDPEDHQLIAKLCDRRFGIGGDGLILLEDHTNYDFQMVYFNSDGRQSSMCGNGGRCIVKFAYDLRVIGDTTSFIAIDGEHEACVKNGIVHLKMVDVKGLELIGNDRFLDTGSPHYIQFVDSIKDFPVVEEGRKIRYNDRFKKEGTNVNFVRKEGSSSLVVRTYERGVEDETWSCGTGVTASAIAAFPEGVDEPVKIKTLGGDLSVSFKKNDSLYYNVYLNGPAVQVYKGEIEI